MPTFNAEVQLPVIKWCAACKKHLPIHEFWKNCRAKDGLTTSCKACKAHMDANWRAKSAEKIKAYKAIKKFYYLAKANNQRAQKVGAVGTVSAEELEAAWNVAGGKCLCCGTTDNLAFDHIQPFIVGGTHSAENLQLLCDSCNFLKGGFAIDFRGDTPRFLTEQHPIIARVLSSNNSQYRNK